MSSSSTINRACENCKRKKIRCDGARPYCGQCVKATSSCHYPRRKPRGPGIASVEDATGYSPSDPCPDYRPSQQSLPPLRLATPSGHEQHDTPPDGEVVASIPQTARPPSWSSTVENFPMIEEDYSLNVLLSSIPDVWQEEVADVHWGRANLDWTILAPTYPSSDPMPQPPMPVRTSLGVPSSIVDHLLSLYFQHTQHFLPLLHKPRIDAKTVNLPNDDKYDNLAPETSFLLNSIMALSARYSRMPYFQGVRVKDRGSVFAKQAQEYCDALITLPLSMEFLQGCILSTFYFQSSVAITVSQFWLDRCTTTARAMDLSRTDEAPSGSISTVDREIDLEERRRAWWILWEVDCMNAALSRGLTRLKWGQSHIFFPMSDSDWFTGRQSAQLKFHSDPKMCWRVLKKADTSDHRAWYLMAVHLFISVHDLAQSAPDRKDPGQAEDLATAISCFSLLLHSRIDLTGSRLGFSHAAVVDSVWMILLLLHLQSARLLLFLHSQAPVGKPLLNVSNTLAPIRSTSDTSEASSHVQSSSQTAPPPRHRLDCMPMPCVSSDECSRFLEETIRLCRLWSPDRVAFWNPLMIFLICGPAYLNLRIAREKRTHPSISSAEEELLVLLMTHLAKYWNLGHLILGKH